MSAPPGALDEGARARRVRLRAAGALALLAVLWGYNWVVMKRALDDAGPFEFTALRGVLCTASLFVLLRLMGRPLRPPPLAAVALVGLFQTVGNGGLAAAALVTGGAGRTATLVYLMPFWTLLLAWLMLGERIRGAQWIAVGLALAGMLLIVAPWQPQTALLASACALGSGLCWCAAAVTVKRLRMDARVGLISLTAWQMAFGSVVLIVLALAFPLKPVSFTPYMLWALFYNVIPTGAVGWLLWLYALDRLPAGTASLGTLAIPVVGVACAAVELGERPPDNEFAGMALIGCALALLAWLALRAHKADNPLPAQE